jgi:hypothetical protein
MLFALRISPLVLWIDSQAESFVIAHELMTVAVFTAKTNLARKLQTRLVRLASDHIGQQRLAALPL